MTMVKVVRMAEADDTAAEADALETRGFPANPSPPVVVGGTAGPRLLSCRSEAPCGLTAVSRACSRSPIVDTPAEAVVASRSPV